MSAAPAPADARVCVRAGLERPVMLAIDGGATHPGTLVNASLGGALVALGTDAGGYAVGQTVGLRLDVADEGSPAYACTVVRVDGRQVALALERKAAVRFGLALTKGMFVRN